MSRHGLHYLWMIGGAFVVGSALWAMHFVGTVALELDGPARHSVPELMASYVAAIVAAGVGIWESAGVRLGLARLIGGGLLMGGALSTRHVAGLSAMRRPTVAVWEPELVAASLFVAIVVATGVIGLRYLVRNESRHMSRPKPLAAIDISGAMVLSRIVGIQSAEWMVDERHSPAKLAARTIVIESDAVAAVIVTAPSLLVFTAVLAAVDRKLMERARASRESERRYRQVFQKSLTGRYRSTRDGQLLECNEAFARIFGYASPEDCAANVMQEAFVASDDRAQFISEPEGVGPVVDRERQMRRRDGPEIAWIAHAMKSSAQQMGALELTAACVAAETAGADGRDPEAAVAGVAAMEREFAAAREWMEALAAG